MERTILYRVGAVVQAPTPLAVDVIRDAYVLVQGNRFRAVAPWSARRGDVGVDEVHDLSEFVMTPAFADAHVHLPQFDIRGHGSADLLTWLKETVFPEEMRFADVAHARAVARRFFRALPHFGTLAAGVYLPVQEEAARVTLEEASRTPLRVVAGKVVMDRNVPRQLADASPEAAVGASARLADEFHGVAGVRYAVTPRFAPACSARLLALSGKLARERQLPVQTHLSETTAEIEWVRRLFPNAPDYLAVYEGTGLSGPRTVFGHGIHLEREEWRRLAGAGACVAHCPLSNDALGSGRFPLEDVPAGARVALATDVGASPSASVLDAMAHARAVHPVNVATPARLLHLATSAAAAALGAGDACGRIAAGFDASFLLWRPEVPPRDPLFEGDAFVDGLMARARDAGAERVRPERVVARGIPV